MSSKKIRFISRLLSFVMTLAMVLGLVPPLKVSAAAPTSTFPNKTETMYIGEDYDFTGTATYNSSKIDIVHVDIQGPDTQTVGVSYYREEGLNKTSFRYGSYIDSFTWGDTIESYDGSESMDTSEPGKYWIIVYTKAQDGTISTRQHIINLKEKKLEEASTTFDLDVDVVNLGDTIGLRGKVDSGDYYIRAIEINIRNKRDKRHGYTHQRVEFDYSDEKTTYYLSNFDDIETDIFYKCSGCGETETLGAGEHEVVISVGLYSPTGGTAEGFTEDGYYFEVKEAVLEDASTTFDLDDDVVNLDDTIGLRGKVDSGSYYIRAIEVIIRNKCDKGHGYTHQRVEFKASDKKKTYSLSDFDDIETDFSYKCSGCGETETLGVGEHEVVISVGLYSPTGGSAEGFTKDGYYFEVKEAVLEDATTTFSLDHTEVAFGNTIGLSGEVDSGSYYIRAIEVIIRNKCDKGHGYTHQRVEFKASDKKKTYSLSDFDDIEIGMSYKCAGCGKTETLEIGKHEAVISVGLYSPTGGSAEGFTKDGYYFDVITNDFVINSIKPSVYSVNTQVGVDFTITTNSAVKYGVDIYAGDYFLKRITDCTENGNQIIYTYKGHKFTSSGTKTIYVYPVTSSDAPDKTVSSSCEITVNAPYGRIGNPEFTTANNQTVPVDEPFTIAWNKPSAPSSGIRYNVYVMKSGTNDNKLLKKGMSSRTCSVPASYLKDEGQYIITVYALAPGYEQNATGATLVVNAKSDDSVYVMSVTPSKTDTKTLTDVDFTIKASTSAKYGVAIYAGKYHLATIKNKTSYSGYIKYVYKDHRFTSGGVKNIYVYPLDSKENILQDEGTYATCSIHVEAASACGTPAITTATNQTISLNSDFKVSWKRPSVPSSGVKYNVYVRHSYTEDGEPLDNVDKCVNTSMITSTSLTIDSSYFTKKGSYTITVYAMASGYTQSSPAAITVYVSDGNRLQVNVKELTAYEGGGKGNNITVTANVGWTVTSDVNWITFSTASGNGNGQFYPIIATNDSADERSGNIIVSGGGITRKILVKQGGVLINNSAQEDSVYNQDVATVRVEVFAQKMAGIELYVLTEGVSVSYGRTTTKTDANGIATIAYDADSGYDLIVSKAGYSSQKIEAKRLSKNNGVINVTLKLAEANVKPVINAVWVLDTNILKDAYAIDLLSQYSTSFVADVDWGSDSYGSISLWQNGKQAKFTGNSLKTVLSEKFDVSQKIYIVATNASGKETKAELKFDVGGGYPEWIDNIALDFSDSFTLTFPTSIPLLGGSKLSVDMDDVESLPISICVEGNKVYGSIGLNLLSYKNDGIKKEVKYIKDLFNEAMKGMTTDLDLKNYFKDLSSKYKQQLKYPKGKFLFEADVKAIGFFEGYINSYGELTFLDSGLVVNPSLGVKKSGTFTIPVAPMIPLVWEAALKGELEARLNLYAKKAASAFIPYGDIDGKVSLSGGLGVGVSGIASVTGGIKGTLEPSYELHRDLSSHFKLDASLGLYAKVKLAIFEHTWEHELARSTWLEYPSARNYSMYSMLDCNTTLLGDYSDTSDYELQNRDYINHYSGFTMNDYENAAPYALFQTFSMRSDVSTDKTTVFYENIYPNAEPVIGTFDDGTMIAVYIGDDTTRTDINRTRLYYSFYNGIEWSQPVPVDANGKTADFTPALVIAQNKAFITWQDATKTFSNSDSLESIAPYFDISIAVFDPTNKNIVAHTIESTGLDMTPIICANDDNVSVVWVNNALNDWYGCNNANSILAYTYMDNGWGNVVNLKSSLTSIRSIDAQYIGGVLNTIYSIDTDNNVETVTDINTYLLRNSSDTIIKSNNGIVNSAIIRNGTVYWYENGNIMYCDADNLSAVNSIFSPDVTYSINTYDVLDNGYEKYAIFIIGDGLYSKLGISVFDDSSMTWSDIVYITDGSNMISDYDAVITSDGFVRIIATQTAVVGDMTSSNPYGLSDIIICDVYINGDLKVEDVTFDMSKTVGDTTAEVYAYVVNNGKETIDGSVISIYDKNLNLISTSIDETVIKPGAEATLIAYMDIDDAIIGSDVIVIVKPRGINDVNQTDNSVEVTVNYFDVAVEQIAYGRNSNGKAVIYANVVNRGYRVENNITAYLRKGSADASIIASTQISSLDMFDSLPVQFAVTYEEGAVYYITISENDGDMMTSNNQDFVVLVDESAPILLGDVNLDGDVTMADATLLLQHIAKITTITDMQALANAEVTGDATLTMADSTKILQYVAKIIGSLE